MSTSKKLSDDEVEALVGGLADEASQDLTGYSGEIKAVRLGVDDLSVLGDYFALRMINERFCRLVKSIFTSIFRAQPSISAFPPEIKTFAEYKNGTSDFVSLTISKVDALKGSQLLVLEPELVSALTSTYYGGSMIKTLRKIDGEFTATEELVIEQVTKNINDMLENAWSELLPISLDIQSHEEQLQQTSFMDDDDTAVCCGFQLQLGDEITSRIDIVYPLQMLKPIASQLNAKPSGETSDRDLTWRQQLERAVLTIPLNLSAEVARAKIDIGNLSEVKINDALPVTLRDGVTVRIGGKHLYTAELGNKSNITALEIRTKH